MFTAALPNFFPKTPQIHFLKYAIQFTPCLISMYHILSRQCFNLTLNIIILNLHGGFDKGGE